jgi:hypothetical protein
VDCRRLGRNYSIRKEKIMLKAWDIHKYTGG